jgi:ferredoxin
VVAVFIMGLSAGAASAATLGMVRVVAGVQLLPSLARAAAGGLAGLTGLGLAWLLVLGFTVVFGRFYCSTLCPLGLLQDAAAWLGRVGQKLVFRGKARGKTGAGRRSASVGIKDSSSGLASLPAGNLEGSKGFPFYGRILLAVAGVLGAVFAPAVLAWLEPYALSARLGAALFGTAWEFAGEGAIRFGVFLPAEPLRFDPAWMAAALVPGLLVLGAAVRRPRLFCRWLCPAGALLRLAADSPVLGFRIQGEVCTSCGACQRVCRTGAADSPGRRIDSGACVGCFDCMVVCPVGAVRYGRLNIASTAPTSIKEEANKEDATKEGSTASPVFSRRNFMLAGGTGLAAAALTLPAAGLARRPSTAALVTLNGKARAWASPPGSGSVDRFSRLCLSCGLCARACPSGVLRQGLAWWKSPAILEPYMDYARGFCQFECVACGEVCPSGAIQLLPVDAKTTVAVARSSLELPKCIVTEKGTPCGACAEHCPTGALAMARVPAHRHPIPVLDETLCVGCGACETVCPSEPIKALVVSGLAVHETARVLPERPGAAAQATGRSDGRPGGVSGGDSEGELHGEPPYEQVPDTGFDDGVDGFPF